MLNPAAVIVQEDISVSGDVIAFNLESDYTISKDNIKQWRMGRDIAKKIWLEASKKLESVTISVTGSGHFNVIELEFLWLNNYTKICFNQQTKGMENILENEAMKHAPENGKKECFRMMAEYALVVYHNCLLELQFKQQELMTHLEALNDNNENGNN